MKFHSLYLKETCHGRLANCGHTITLGAMIASITFDATTQLFEVVETINGNRSFVPVSNIRNAIPLPEDLQHNEKEKAKGK